MRKQVQARYVSGPRLPRSFWYSIGFAAAYLAGFGIWILLQQQNSLMLSVGANIGAALAALFGFMLSWIGVKGRPGMRGTGAHFLWGLHRLQFWTPLLFSSAFVFQVAGNLLIANNNFHQQFAFSWLVAIVMGGRYPALLLGVLMLPRPTLSGRLPLYFVLDSLMLLVAVVTFSWYFTLGPTLLQAAGGSLPRVVSGATFLFFDLLLVSSLILLIRSTADQGLRLAISSLCVALIIFAITDSFSIYLALQGVHIMPAWLSLGRATGNFAIVLSIQVLRWLSDRTTTKDTLPLAVLSDAKTALWRTLLPYALVPAVFGLVWYVWKTDREALLDVGTYCCAAVLLVLIFLKQIVVMREIHLLNRKFMRAQETLHEKNEALEQANARLEALATTDMLTNLPNHRALQTLLDQEGERARRFGHPLSMLFFDGDRFKNINDTYGHATGDLVLRELGERARSVLRVGDTVGRFGGEEFLVLLPETGEQEACAVAERLRSAVASSPLAEHAVEGGIAVTVSIGVASYPADGASASAIREQADQAMYWAKRLGRNQVRTAAEAERASRDAALKTATAHALERQELVALDGHNLEGQIRAEQLGLVYSLMAALDVREPGLSAHAHAVSDLVTAMARELKFDEERLLRAATAAFLHDIGKIALPDRLLQQPRQYFSQQEWRLLQQHAELGADIVEASPWLTDLASAIRHHHERWDGAGSPDGLSGEAIPLEARLIAVAEAYHAIISDRPYQTARSVREALDELKRGAGSQFDPALVPLLLVVLASQQEVQALSQDYARSIS